MPTVGLFNKEAKQVGEIQLNDNVFAVEVNKDAMHQVVVALLANKRQGTQSAKTRAEVRGGGIKPWRQKGTALTCKVQNEEMIVLENLEFEAIKTKSMAEMLKAFNANKTLIVTAESNEVVYKSARNIEGVSVIPVNNINVYDLLKFEKVIMTKDAVSKIEEVYA
ncbi:MAG: 50S ribosomal protein L4 [Clostridium sp.]|nr:50S ribosomal protein L4 [Clostridium sp.]